MSILDEIFRVIPADFENPGEPLLWHLPRRAAEELQVLGCLAPVICSNLAVPFDDQIYATDASLSKRGKASACVSEEIAKALWRSAERRAAAVPVLSKNQAILAVHDKMFEECPATERPVLHSSEGFLGDHVEEKVSRPIGLKYDFIEVCGGSGVIRRGPVLDLSLSKQFDLRNSRVIQWILFLFEDDRLMSVMLSPPCTSFSAAAHPCARSYQLPRGFDQKNEKVKLGNQLACACLAIMQSALRLGKLALLEQPRRSKMRWLTEWQRLIELGASETWLASCMYGSIHQKEFVLLGANMHHYLLHRPCSRDHRHVKIEGPLTKPSSIYCPGLAFAFAKLFRDHIWAVQKASARLALKTYGLEDLLTNDVCSSWRWEECFSWRWKTASRINVLELSAVVKLLRELALQGGDRRVTLFIDSHVVLSCVVRGRSSAESLKSLLKKVCAVSISSGIYVAGRFAPTRLNPGDHPSRDAEIPDPVPCSVSQHLANDPDRLRRLASSCSLRRWISNWTRLALLLVPTLLDFGRCPGRLPQMPIGIHEWTLGFDSTLGYPGEGPQCVMFKLLYPLGFVVVACAAPSTSHGDASRKAARAGIVLEGGRRVTETTSFTREFLFEFLFANFKTWVTAQGRNIDDVVFQNPPDLDLLNTVLVQYGRWLFQEGKPYYHFSETVNAVASKRPIVRRSMQQAWDLAFMWGSYEPVEHHVAMPHQVLLALISAAWMWGWVREAAAFALAWGALLRIGEVLEAYRSDLVLPSDVFFSMDYALLKVSEQKTRFRAACHQCGRLECPDLLEVVKIGFGQLIREAVAVFRFYTEVAIDQAVSKARPSEYKPFNTETTFLGEFQARRGNLHDFCQ